MFYNILIIAHVLLFSGTLIDIEVENYKSM